MLSEPWAYMRDTMFPDWSESIEADELSTGFFAPPDWQNRMFNAIYGTVYEYAFIRSSFPFSYEYLIH